MIPIYNVHLSLDALLRLHTVSSEILGEGFYQTVLSITIVLNNNQDLALLNNPTPC